MKTNSESKMITKKTEDNQVKALSTDTSWHLQKKLYTEIKLLWLVWSIYSDLLYVISLHPTL